MVQKSANRRDHLANERTFLAWIRTNLGIMAFGFVIEKFSFFIREIASFVGRSEPHSALQGDSSIFGISLVGIGALLCIFAFLKYKKAQKEIDDETYQPSNKLVTLLAFFVFFTGVFLIVYLFYSKSSVVL